MKKYFLLIVLVFFVFCSAPTVFACIYGEDSPEECVVRDKKPVILVLPKSEFFLGESISAIVLISPNSPIYGRGDPCNPTHSNFELLHFDPLANSWGRVNRFIHYRACYSNSCSKKNISCYNPPNAVCKALRNKSSFFWNQEYFQITYHSCQSAQNPSPVLKNIASASRLSASPGEYKLLFYYSYSCNGPLLHIEKPFRIVDQNLSFSSSSELIAPYFAAAVTEADHTCFEEESAFLDIEDSPYSQAIESLYRRGIIAGYDDNTFRPNNFIDRAAFMKIIMEAVYPDESVGSNCFSDVSDEWYAKYICYAQSKGIVNGYTDGSFRPENNINVAEALKITLQAFVIPPETDVTEPWYEPYAVVTKQHRLLPPDITSYDADLRRDQVSELIYRIFKSKASL